MLARRVLAGAAVAAALGSIGTAQAATLRADGAVHLMAQHCAGGTAARLAPEAAPQPSAPVVVPYSKSAAILGGQPSALDLIRQSQELGDLTPASGSLAATEPAPIPPLSPAIGGARVRRAGCLAPAIAAPARLPGSDDILASKRLAIGQTPYDSDWQRVSGDRISARRVRRLIGDTSDRRATLQSVNSWVNRSIAFTDDRELFRRADFWAGAATTLRLRRGDCEDIALTKMELLAAAGVPREDMILTIARDLVRNADHAVLMVRHDGHYVMLDNASDELFDGSLDHDYRPILSFGSNQTWLHGY